MADDATKPPVLRAADFVDRSLTRACQGVVLVSGTALLGCITIGVVARYAISVGGVDWAEELPKQLFAWFIMAGVVLAVLGGNHIAVDLAMRVLGGGARRLLIVATNLMIAVAYVFLCGTALNVAEIASIEINPILGVPGSLTFYALAAGSALTSLGTLSIAVRVFCLGADAAPQGRPEDSVQ